MAVPSSPGATARALIAAGVDLDQELPFLGAGTIHPFPPGGRKTPPSSGYFDPNARTDAAERQLAEDRKLRIVKNGGGSSKPPKIKIPIPGAGAATVLVPAVAAALKALGRPTPVPDYATDIPAYIGNPETWAAAEAKEVPFTINPENTLLPEQPFVRGSLSGSLDLDIDRQDEISRLKQLAGGMKGYGDFNISDKVRSQSALTLIDNMVTSSEDAKLIAGSDTKKAVESAVEKWLLPALGIGDVKADIFKSPRIEVDQTEIQEKRDAELRTLLDKAKSEVFKGVDFEAPRSRPRYRGMKPVNKPAEESVLNRLMDLREPRKVRFADPDDVRRDNAMRLAGAIKPDVESQSEYMQQGAHPWSFLLNALYGEETGTTPGIGGVRFEKDDEGVWRDVGVKRLQDYPSGTSQSDMIELQRVIADTPLSLTEQMAARDRVFTDDKWEQLRPGVGTESGVGTDIVPVRGPTSQVDTFADMPTAAQQAAERVQQAAIQRKEDDARARAKEVAAAERQREQQREGARRRAEEQAQARQREQQREGARRRAEEQREQAARARESARREQQRERKQAAAERAARNKEAQQRQRQQERAQAASRRAASRAAAARAAASRARPTPVRRRTGGRPSRTWRQPSRGRGR